jgi:hypothetical protein
LVAHKKRILPEETEKEIRMLCTLKNNLHLGLWLENIPSCAVFDASELVVEIVSLVLSFVKDKLECEMGIERFLAARLYGT